MNTTKKYFISVFISVLFLLSAHQALAATVYVLPSQGTFKSGDVVSIDIKIDSEGASINAAQATLNWPSNILQFTTADKTSSVFNFWIQEPDATAASSSVSFVGGAAKGVSGATLQVLKINFKALAVGTAEISFTDVAVTASDGKGTNVLSKTTGGTYGIGVPAVQPPPLPPEPGSPPSPEVPVPQPVSPDRKPVPAVKVPQAPEVSVPLYPNQEKWYNRFGEVVVLWNIPDDVIAASVQVDQNPNTQPTIAEKVLYNGKKIGILEDGIWYVHVRFKNNIGWGVTTHYRISLDSQPPLGFEITAPEGETTDDPAPMLKFETTDALSGVSEYRIWIDDGDAAKISMDNFKGTFQLSLQAPGQHKVIVRAVDLAENSTEAQINLEILAIPSPGILFVTRQLFSDAEQGLVIRGTGIASTDILLKVQRVSNEEVIMTGIARVDDRGGWEFAFDKPLNNGIYIVTAQSQDDRGALSAEVNSSEITVVTKPLFQFGVLQIGKGATALILFCMLIASFFGGILFYRKRQGKIVLRAGLVESEVTKIFKLISEDVERLSQAHQTPTTGDDEYALKRIQENIKKMEGYLKKGIEKIKK